MLHFLHRRCRLLWYDDFINVDDAGGLKLLVYTIPECPYGFKWDETDVAPQSTGTVSCKSGQPGDAAATVAATAAQHRRSANQPPHPLHIPPGGISTRYGSKITREPGGLES